MNKFQLVVLWLASIGLCVYLCMKEEPSYYIGSAGVVALAAIVTYYSTRKQDHGHYSMPQDLKQKTAAKTNISGNAESSVAIPGPGGSVMVFGRESVEYKGKTYAYKKFTGMYYNVTSLSVHGVPTSQNYSFGASSADGDLTVYLASVFYINNKQLKELFDKLILLVWQHIQPQIMAHLMREIFKNGKIVKIGPIEFTNKGYSAKKFFGGIEFVGWKERIYIPQVFEGYVYVYKDKDGKHKKLKTLSTRTMNAVLLPALVQACYDEVNIIHGEQPQTDNA